jgi:RNA polymerase sigma-70 factor (ECF subfamily)
MPAPPGEAVGGPGLWAYTCVARCQPSCIRQGGLGASDRHMTVTELPAARIDPSQHDAALDDAALVARAAAGDRSAFEALYRHHSAPLYRTALAISRDSHVAEELLQESFVRAYRSIGRVQLDQGASLRPWLHRILINLAYDWSSKQRNALSMVERSGRQLLPAAPTSPEGQLEAAELKRAVLEAVDDLPFKQRIVVVLFYLHEMDLEEIASTLDLPPGTVKSRLYYGRARLRERLASDKRLASGLEVRYAPS